MTGDLEETFEKVMNEPEEAKPERPTHIHGTMRANLARALAEAEGISLGEAVARIMADETMAAADKAAALQRKVN